MKYPISGQAKPFIKWAGGKSQLLSDIEKSLPVDFTNYTTYVEPFVGGGAVIFWILQKYPHIQRAVINDINEKLINVYRTIKNQPEKLIVELQTLQDTYLPLAYEGRTDMFMEKRNRFNTPCIDGIEQAALFIFLNRTCFNGLYRENSKGNFNVPHGKYSKPTICDAETIIADSHVLQKVEILCGDFAQTAQFASEQTLFYFDPPYKPLSETSSFNSYVKEVFDDNEQIRLRDFCSQLSANGSKFILSNSDVKGKNPEDNFFDDLYSDYSIRRVYATRMVNANPDKRGKLSELMISNINNHYVEPSLFSQFNF
ncbi:MAG: DNA adenine methylase [Bacteroidales bacterium]|nr:DNA adenine methylase [Bacteroidales bacterium]MCD8394253.1 DNA adenine methylase [Bacteroidales bacterium]